MSQQELTWKVSIDPAIAAQAMRSLAEEAKTSTASIEASVRQEAQAAAALQRQRSAALIAQWKGDTKEAENAAKQQAAVTLKGAAQAAAGQIALAQSTSAAHRLAGQAVEELGSHLNVFVGERIPLAGGAFIRLTDNLKNFHLTAGQTEGSVLNLGKAIGDISAKSGKAVPDVTAFLQTFVHLETQAKKDTAAVEFFGAGIAQNLQPQLRAATTEMEALAASGGSTAATIGSMAGPIGIAILALLAMAAVGVVVTKELLDTALSTAEFEDRLFNLSKQLGINVETLSGLEILAKQTGLDVGELSASIGLFQRHLEQAHDPTSKSASLLKSLGVESTDTEQALRQTFATLSRMPEGFRQTATALDLFGRSGKNILAILKQTDGDLDAAIAKFREMGLIVTTEDAKAAHEFTDQLALLGFQARAVGAILTRDLIPQLSDSAERISDDLEKNKEGIQALGELIGAFAKPAILGFTATVIIADHALRDSSSFLKGSAVASLLAYVGGVNAATLALRELHQEQGKPGEQGITGGAKGEKSAPLEQASQEADLNTIKNAATEAKQIATNALQGVDQAFERGQISRREQILQTIGLLKRGEAEQQKAIQATLDQLDAQKKTAVDTIAIEKKIDDTRSQARTTRRQLESDVAKQQALLDADQTKQRIQHLHDETDAFVQANARKIQIIQQAAAAFKISDLTALAETKKLTEQDFAIKEAALKKELGLAGKNVEQQEKINKQLRDLDDQRTKTRLDQDEKIRQAEEKTDTAAIERQKTRIDTQLRLSQIVADGSIASLKALAVLRIKTEEETEKAILAIRLKAKDAEIDANKALLTAAGGIKDPRARAAEEAKLNGELKILQAERRAIQAQGERDAEDGRQRDLEHQREYQSALEKLQIDGLRGEEDIARLRIELLRATHASGLLILQAELAERTAAEDKRQAQVLRELEDDRNKALKKARGTEELLAILKAYNLAVEEENKRHAAAGGVIDAEGAPVKRALHPAALDSIFGVNFAAHAAAIRKQLDETGKSATRLAIVFQALGASIQDSLSNRIAALPSLMDLVNGAIDQEIQGIGALINNWVLYGTTGPDALRKVTAEVLASFAQQAAVAALYYTAQGIVDLFFNPVQAAADFAAAAIWFGIAGGSALAGRAVAGNAFQQASGTNGTGNRIGGSSSTSGTSASNNQGTSMTLGSQRPQVVIHKFIPPPGYGESILIAALDSNHPEVTRLLARERDR